jgi:hypothetical protein
VAVAWTEIVTFTFFHGIPVEIGPSKPYWGDGTGDALQWVGFLAILACSAAIIHAARRPSPPRIGSRSTTLATAHSEP